MHLPGHDSCARDESSYPNIDRVSGREFSSTWTPSVTKLPGSKMSNTLCTKRSQTATAHEKPLPDLLGPERGVEMQGISSSGEDLDSGPDFPTRPSHKSVSG